MHLSHIIFTILGIFLLIYIIFFSLNKRKIQKVEREIIDIFLLKVSKIAGLIEVMRPFVADETIFVELTKLHSKAIIQDYGTIYILLEQNARIHEEFQFLMKLAVQIPALQKDAEFLYIRHFIITYEQNLKTLFKKYNLAAENWNRFVKIKNLTIIGFFLPGKKKELI